MALFAAIADADNVFHQDILEAKSFRVEYADT